MSKKLKFAYILLLALSLSGCRSIMTHVFGPYYDPSQKTPAQGDDCFSPKRTDRNSTKEKQSLHHQGNQDCETLESDEDDKRLNQTALESDGPISRKITRQP